MREIGGTCNRLKLGIFGPNCSSGLAKTKVPERWSGSWDDNLALVRMVDDAGLEFILPVGRWKGYGGETDPHAATFETVTWATGMLCASRRVTVFATLHAPLIHPIFAAKMCVTADHAGHGRFALNIVCGSHDDEFRMFGAPQRPSEDAYAYGAEWLDVVKRLWTESAPFDYHGGFFHLEQVQGAPKPYGGTRPVVLNAGISPAGKAFGMLHADTLFTGLTDVAELAGVVRTVRDGAAAHGRTIEVYSTVNVVCRPRASDAEDYYRYFAHEMADWDALAGRLGDYKGYGEGFATEQPSAERMRLVAGYGGYPCVGDPDRVAGELARIAAAGIGGIALGFVNYLDELPFFCDTVLPRLEALGVREPQHRGGGLVRA